MDSYYNGDQGRSQDFINGGGKNDKGARFVCVVIVVRCNQRRVRQYCHRIAMQYSVCKQSDAKVTGKGQTVGDAWDDVWRIHR